MDSIVLTLLMLLSSISSSAALKLSAKPHQPHQPELVQLLVNPGTGSTALSQLLMSSEKVATLCNAGTWQCEPCNFMEGTYSVDLCADTESDVNALRNATDTWAKYWDLSRPLLMKKAMLDVMRHTVVEAHQMYINMVAEGLPQRMQNASIDGLRFAYIGMWRPLCLSKMSRSFQDVPTEVEYLEYLSSVVEMLPKLGARVLLVNYGSLLWDSERTKKRVEEFLPEAGPLDTRFHPRLNIDVFPGNTWKATESISEYAAIHQNTTVTSGYNVKSQTCEKDEFGEEFAHLRTQYESAVAHLKALSV